MSDEAARMARAGEAENALAYLQPHFDAIRADYVQGLAAWGTKPMCDKVRAAIEKLAVGIKVLDEVRAQIAASIADGTLAEHDAHRASGIAEMSTEKRRWIGY